MTKVTVLGEQPKEGKKKIEFSEYLRGDLKVEKFNESPSSYENIELICRDYIEGKDLMFAYNNGNRSCGILFIGKFNDGVV